MHINKKLYSPIYEKYCTDLKWYPWVGKGYAQRSKKLLILGESSYIWEAKNKDDHPRELVEDKDFIKHIVSTQGLKEDYGENGYWRLYRSIEQTIFNASKFGVTEVMRKKLWSNISFTNLVQRPMESIKHRPTYEYYVESWQKINEAIKSLSPTYVLVVGNEDLKIGAFMEVFNKQVIYEKEKLNGTVFKQVRISNIQFAFTRHMSSRYSWSKWAEKLKPYNLIDYIN
jgi:hypothetical protein